MAWSLGGAKHPRTLIPSQQTPISPIPLLPSSAKHLRSFQNTYDSPLFPKNT